MGNGWYNRELAEVQFWKQSNHLVHRRKNLGRTCATRMPDSPARNCFWWFNMYSSADYSITPRRCIRPMAGSSSTFTRGRSIREEIKRDLGEFPFFGFLGAGGGMESPQGSGRCRIALDCRIRQMDRKQIQPDAEPDLPAASRLQSATAWTQRQPAVPAIGEPVIPNPDHSRPARLMPLSAT